jgi:hypothetical protein
LFFDIIHYLFHQCSKSNHTLLRRLGYLHQIHHLYFNRNLKFNPKYHWLNIWVELPLELSCQLLGSYLSWLLLPRLISKNTLLLVLAAEIFRVMVVAFLDGQDSNHKNYPAVPKDPLFFLVGPQYHALHHINPSAYISSTFRLFDWVFGTACSLESRRVTITGASGAFGSAMKQQLKQENVSCVQELKFGMDWTHSDTISVLASTDILILAHGSRGKDAVQVNCESTIALIELFRRHHKPGTGHNKMLLPEIWYVGSEAELHPCFSEKMRLYAKSKRAFLPYARALYDDQDILYRHIVPAAFQSPMGNAIVSSEWAAKVALWWIRRGARYTPVTYTGIAYLNYFKFVYCVKKAGKI